MSSNRCKNIVCEFQCISGSSKPKYLADPHLTSTLHPPLCPRETLHNHILPLKHFTKTTSNEACSEFPAVVWERGQRRPLQQQLAWWTPVSDCKSDLLIGWNIYIYKTFDVWIKHSVIAAHHDSRILYFVFPVNHRWERYRQKHGS